MILFKRNTQLYVWEMNWNIFRAIWHNLYIYNWFLQSIHSTCKAFVTNFCIVFIQQPFYFVEWNSFIWKLKRSGYWTTIKISLDKHFSISFHLFLYYKTPNFQFSRKLHQCVDVIVLSCFLKAQTWNVKHVTMCPKNITISFKIQSIVQDYLLWSFSR